MVIRAMVVIGVLASRALATDPVFEVSFDASVRDAAATGRLVVYLIGEGSKENAHADPADGPFFDDPQPMFGISVKDLRPGEKAVVDNAATGFPVNLSGLPAGAYRVQAVLDLHREDSSWKREEGNLYSEVVSLRLNEVDAPERHAITLTKVVKARPFPGAPGVEEFTVRSALLSAFHGREVVLKAGVRLPRGYGAAGSKRFPTVYEVPGFGGDHHDAAEGPHPLGGGAFWVVLNPESGNGHTLFADSANNGPWGRALVEELIPALEARYRMIPEAGARVLRGHSSGGWSTLWLLLNHPGTFGATWSTSPDPVDFRRFQIVDIYSDENAFVDLAPPQRGGKERPSYRRDGRERMTIRQENMMEEVLGPDNTSGQQWDSWFAVFGPRNERGNPAALFDLTGAIDRGVAERYRAYDIGALVRGNREKHAPLFHERVRLIVGDADNYYLNEAVALVKAEVGARAGEGRGSITILPGLDHGTVFMAPEMRGIPSEIMDHFRRAGYAAP